MPETKIFVSFIQTISSGPSNRKHKLFNFTSLKCLCLLGLLQGRQILSRNDHTNIHDIQVFHRGKFCSSPA